MTRDWITLAHGLSSGMVAGAYMAGGHTQPMDAALAVVYVGANLALWWWRTRVVATGPTPSSASPRSPATPRTTAPTHPHPMPAPSTTLPRPTAATSRCR